MKPKQVDHPVASGWYFWQGESRRSRDPFYWVTYYYEDSGDSYWRFGTEMNCPTGGTWMRIALHSELSP